MKVNCAGVPIDYKLAYDKERRQITTTKLPAALKREVRTAYGDPLRADDAAPLVVYYTTDRAGYRLPKKLPKEVPRGQAAAYTGALFNRTVNFRDFMARFRVAIALENEEQQANPSFLGDHAVNAISRALETFLGGFRTFESPKILFACWSIRTVNLLTLHSSPMVSAPILPWAATLSGGSLLRIRCLKAHSMVPGLC